MEKSKPGKGERVNGLDLFSGIGGISIALSPWVETVAYCEQDKYAQSVLLSRIAEGKLHRAPIWDDVQTLTGEMLPPIDIIFGGFPCQDLSVAGAGKGLAGERSGLFYEIIRLVRETRPSFVFLENVPAIRTRGLAEVTQVFTEVGYDCRWTSISASSIGAPHIRERWFLLSHANSDRSKQGISLQTRHQGKGLFSGGDGQNGLMAHSECAGLERFVSKAGESKESELGFSGSHVGNSTSKRVLRNKRVSDKTSWSGHGDVAGDPSWWDSEPAVGRVAHGVHNRVDRIKCLGNSVVPAQVREAFETLIGFNSINNF